MTFQQRPEYWVTPNTAINTTQCTKYGIRNLLVWLLLASMALTGCVQNDDVADDSNSGELILGLTDAPGDFVHYTVDVTQITLTKLNGAVVNVLPVSTQVDFAQYTDMTEFLTAARVPTGIYKTATLSLDYSMAEIWVEGDNGSSAVRVSNIVDVDGNAISQLDVAVDLEGRHRLLIAPGTPAHMTLDFDLNASNKVEFGANNVPMMTVAPLLLADLELQRPKIHRVRGPLARVDVHQNAFSVIIHPFLHSQIDDSRFGTLAVKVDDKTVYDIDNEDYTGPIGLQALAAMPALSATVVIGRLEFNPRVFVASEVYAGSSVAGGTLDVVKGTVMARSGNVLTIKGATLIRAGGSVIFNDLITVDVADTTKVKKQQSMDVQTIADISVGQAVEIAGTLINDQADALSMDASNGFARLKITSLRGTSVAVVSIPETSPAIVVDLQSINFRRAGQFDFSGTGMDAVNDADPTNYEIATAALDLSAITDGTPVAVKGFVRAFGLAPEDFDAISVTDLSGVRATMAISWNPATTTPFTNSSATAVTLSLTDVGTFHHFGQAGVHIDMDSLTNTPMLLASNDGEGVFVVVKNGSRQLFTQFADFIANIEERLAGGSIVKTMKSSGSFDQASSEMIVRDAIVYMETTATIQ